MKWSVPGLALLAALGCGGAGDSNDVGEPTGAGEGDADADAGSEGDTTGDTAGDGDGTTGGDGDGTTGGDGDGTSGGDGDGASGGDGDGDGTVDPCAYDSGASYCESCGKDSCCPEIEACVAASPECGCVIECLGSLSKAWGECYAQCGVTTPTPAMDELRTCWANGCAQFCIAP